MLLSNIIIVNLRLTAFEKDNDFVYHEKIPNNDELPEIEGVSVVKVLAIDFNDPVFFEDKFSSLIPIEVIALSSLYR